jgi:hypothetical protein
MTFTVQSKSQLARLMATENITINHIKAQTASFDPINRVLYLPIWKDMSGVIYDLLTGHEVGHAQYTPADGWHSAASDKTKSPNYKGFLNVVEDARIEKKIQRKYPGLRMSFKNAYAELMMRDFFGIKNRDVSQMPFIDRLNLYSKSQWTMSVSFTHEEQKLVEKVRVAETWDEVIKITDEIFAYSKDEQQELQQNDFQFFDPEMIDDEDGDENYDADEDGGEDRGVESEGAGNGVGNDEDDEDENADEEPNLPNAINRKKMSQNSYEDQGALIDPICQTDENYRRNESQLLDEKSKEYVYYKIPKANMENILVPHSIVQGALTKSFNAQVNEDQKNEWYSEFKKTNERYINLLVKEFEMRKAAKAFSRSRLADTGEIDVGKLSSYRFDDNIFRKMLLVPKGKSHGLVLLLDKSGSMQDIIGDSIEQILILTMFCRKVNIPFVVYGFGNNSHGYVSDVIAQNRLKDHSTFKEKDFSSFETEVDAIAFSDVRLREYLSSTMSNSVFTSAVKNMLILKRSYNRRNYIAYPVTENLSNTPMTQAVAALANVMKEFKRKNNLDITNLVVVHDGDADHTHIYCNKNELNPVMQFNSQNVFIVDDKIKFQRKLSSIDGMHTIILEWFKIVTGSKIFSFYLTDTRYAKATIKERGCDEEGFLLILNEHKLNESIKKFKKENYFNLNIQGYDKFFVTTPKGITEEDSFDSLAENAQSIRDIKSAFTAANKKRTVSRAMVNQFIQGIAA